MKKIKGFFTNFFNDFTPLKGILMMVIAAGLSWLIPIAVTSANPERLEMTDLSRWEVWVAIILTAVMVGIAVRIAKSARK